VQDKPTNHRLRNVPKNVTNSFGRHLTGKHGCSNKQDEGDLLIHIAATTNQLIDHDHINLCPSKRLLCKADPRIIDSALAKHEN
jgi:hypothetical protein